MLPKDRLIQAAREARGRAYALYSGYKVGAALETDQGQISLGVNVENVTYGATICAERAAVLGMFSNGLGSKVRQIAVFTKDGGTPCGICLQVLAEFATEETLVHCAGEEGDAVTYRLAELLPHAFRSDAVGRTD
jgi:cytidine deaminase